MRLAVLSPFVDRRHGTERALAELLERLSRNYACEIHLYAERVEELSVRDWRSAQGAEPGAIYWHRVARIPGPHLVRFCGWMLLNGLLRGWHAWSHRVSYDVVLSPGINCLHPNVVIVHALFHRLRELAQENQEGHVTPGAILRRWHRRIYYNLLSRLERKTYGNRGIKLAAVSERTRDLLNKYFKRDDAHVIPNGVDTTCFSVDRRLAAREGARRRRGIREGECVLLLVGNDWWTKGLPTVLAAMKALSSLPLRLIVVGNDSAEYFRIEAAQLGVQEQCLWEVPSADVLDFYAAADIYVSPSLEDSFGLPVAESMACGLPVIASVYAGIAGFLRDGVEGFVLKKPSDATELGARIQQLAQDADLRRKIGEAAALKARELDWDCNAEAVWKLLTARA